MKRSASILRCRGFTVTEMLCILGILAVASWLGAQLFTASMKVIDRAPAMQDQHAALDYLSMTLRQDVWGAAKIEVVDARDVALTRPDGSTVRWQFSDTGVIRTENESERRWPLTLAIEVERDATGLILRSSVAQADSADSRRFLSQVLLAAQRGTS